MFELDMSALRKTAQQPWVVANPANLANSIATAPKSDWLTAANVANDGGKAAQQPKPLAKLAGLAGLAISHDLLAVRLMAAAMRRCDHFNDGDTAREAMRQDVLATPLHLQQDLLDYFNEVNRDTKP